MPLAFAARHRPPSDASLRRSLLLAALPKVTELRKKLAGHVAVGESGGVYFRAPECVVGNITGARVLPTGGSVKGLVTVACVWKSADQRTFDSREKAEDAELSESEPGRLLLTFAWIGEHWRYKDVKKDRG